MCRSPKSLLFYDFYGLIIASGRILAQKVRNLDAVRIGGGGIHYCRFDRTRAPWPILARKCYEGRDFGRKAVGYAVQT